MENRSRSTLFLMEQLIVILVFAISAAICVRIFIGSYITASESSDLKNSLIIAESGAECYKAFAGDAPLVSSTLGGSYESEKDSCEIEVFYNKQWQVCGMDDAVYILRIIGGPAEGYEALLLGDISVEKTTGEEILSFTVCAREGVYE